MLDFFCQRSLSCHPATPAPVVSSLDVSIGFISDDRIAFRYCLRGDIARLRVPEPCLQAAQRTDMLWEHTCFEAFIGLQDEPGYREFNFSPSGQWAAYDFVSYRQRAENDPALPAPQITSHQTAGRLELEAVLPRTALPANLHAKHWQAGLTAVIEAADTVHAAHSYWALHHPASRPDFHHRDGHVLLIPAC